MQWIKVQYSLFSLQKIDTERKLMQVINNNKINKKETTIRNTM